MNDPSSLLLILTLSILAPLVADLIPRLKPPGVVLETGLGILVGPHFALACYTPMSCAIGYWRMTG